MKYKKLKSIDYDYDYYMGREGMYWYFNTRLNKNQRRKRDYIWNALLKQYGRKGRRRKR